MLPSYTETFFRPISIQCYRQQMTQTLQVWSDIVRRQWPLLQNADIWYPTKRLQGGVPNQGRPKTVIRWDTEFHEDFNGESTFHSPWLPRATETFCPLGAHNLSKEHEQGRVDWCHRMLRRFDEGRSHQVWNIVTGYETYMYRYKPETIQQLAIWAFPDEDTPIKFTKTRSVAKQHIVFDSLYHRKIRSWS